MSKIGYAILGTSKGLEVISNGLFKELDIDGSLYLDTTSHINIEKNETVLLIKRIPTNLNNLAKKDGFIVALYEYASQYTGTRTGFIGSAICFKDNIPNADKVIQGLFFLFNKMKLNVDENAKLKSDATQWDKNILPDPNGNFGLFTDESLSFNPLKSGFENYVVQVSNLKNDTIGLLTHLCLNYSYHNINHLYVSADKSVINKINKNNISSIEYSSVFNYNNTFKTLQKKLDKKTSEFKVLSENTRNKNSQKDKLEETIKELVSKERAINNTIEQLNKKENNLKNELTSLKEEKSKLATKVTNQKTNLRKANVQSSKPHSRSIQNSRKEEKNTIPKDPGYSPQKIAFGIVSLILVLIGLFFGISFLKDFSNPKKAKVQTEEKSKKAQENKPVQKKKTITIIDQISSFKIKNNAAGLEKHRELVNSLLTDIKSEKYAKESKEYKYALEKKWQYWELYYNNNLQIDLLNKIYAKDFPKTHNIEADVFKIIEESKKYSKKLEAAELEHFNRRLQNVLFIELEKKDSLYYQGTNFLNKSLNESYIQYFKESNEDVYKKIPKEIRKDTVLNEIYFDWILNNFNKKKPIDNKKIGETVMPYITTKATK